VAVDPASLAAAEQRANEMEARMRFVAQQLVKHPEFVTHYGEKTDPWINANGCFFFRRVFGIRIKSTNRHPMQRIAPDVDEARTEMVFVSPDGEEHSAFGSAATSEPYVKGKGRTIGEMRQAAQTFADTRCENSGLRMACGIESLTWDDLKQAGFDMSRARKVERKSRDEGSGEGASEESGRQYAIPPFAGSGANSPKDFLYKVGKSEIGVGGWPAISKATKALFGQSRKIGELSADDCAAVVAWMEANLGAPAVPAQQSAPAQAPTQQAPAQQAPAPQTPPRPVAAGPELSPEHRAAFVELNRLVNELGLTREDTRSLATRLNPELGPKETPSLEVTQGCILVLHGTRLGRLLSIPESDVLALRNRLADEDGPFSAETSERVIAELTERCEAIGLDTNQTAAPAAPF
jgi:hypothetical protein